MKKGSINLFCKCYASFVLVAVLDNGGNRIDVWMRLIYRNIQEELISLRISMQFNPTTNFLLNQQSSSL